MFVQRFLLIIIAMFLAGCRAVNAEAPAAQETAVSDIGSVVGPTLTPTQTFAPIEQGRLIAARVNELPIWLDTFNTEVKALQQIEPQTSEASAIALRASVMNRLIDEQILVQNAKIL